MLEVIDLDTFRGDCHVLYRLSLKVRESSVVALLGRNGMGKTTTIRSIIGLTPPCHGTVRFNEVDITGLPPYRISQAGVGLVPQGRCIFPSLTVKENLTIAARSHGTQDWGLDEVFHVFPRLKERITAYGSELSGGEQQMLAIARALMTNPRLLLMDEPSEGLAPILVKELENIIQYLKTKRTLSILLVEQNFQMATGVSDYVYIISKGRIVSELGPTELIENEEIKAKYLGI